MSRRTPPPAPPCWLSTPRTGPASPLHICCCTCSNFRCKQATPHLDPVKTRVALPAADPPDKQLLSPPPLHAPSHVPAATLLIWDPMNFLHTYRPQVVWQCAGRSARRPRRALALIPEAIAFSIIAGVDPRVGLYASFSIAVLIAFVGGRPGMISAATAATAPPC